MSMIDVPINEIFDLSIASNGSFLTKTFVRDHEGEVPVYGASDDAESPSNASYGYIKDNLEGVKYFEDCLTINRNGSVGKTYYRKERFTINSDVTPLILKEKYKNTLDKTYLCRVVENTVRPMFTYTKKAGKSLFGCLTVPIPVKKDGSYDIDEQRRLAGRYEMVEELRSRIQDETDEILCRVPIIKTSGMKDIPISELFDLDKAGGKALYTKAYCNQHPGKIPVYAASATDPLGFVDKSDYNGGYLTWARNGLAGYLTLIPHPFCINADRGILYPRDEVRGTIDMEYIKYTIEPVFRSLIKRRMGDKGKNEYTKLHPSMIKDVVVPIPVNKDGTYDLSKQQAIAAQYRRIENMKNEIKQKVSDIMSISVIID